MAEAEPVHPLVGRALVEASDMYLNIGDIANLVEDALHVSDPELVRIAGTGLVCELVLNGYVTVEVMDTIEWSSPTTREAISEVWSRWSSFSGRSIQGELIAEFPLTPKGWDIAIETGERDGVWEFHWEGEAYVGRGGWRRKTPPSEGRPGRR